MSRSLVSCNNLSRVRVLLASCTAGLLLSACSPAAPDSSNNTLKVAFFRDNTTLVSLDPFQVYWIEHRVIVRNIADSLTDQDPHPGKIIPWLAQSWDISANALEYTFHLRKDVTFSNGTRFDAQAVKTAFDADKAFANTLPTVFGATYLAGFDHAEVVDDFTVKLVLAKPNAGFLQATSTTQLAILAPESYEKTAKERSAGAIIGSGPFLLSSYTPEVGVHLTKRKGYAWPSAYVLWPNTSADHIFADRNVRLAVQKAIDRKTYASTVYTPEFPVVDGVLDVTTPYFKSQGSKLDYDPQGAEQLLDAAGWVKQADGYRAKKGTRLKLIYTISPAETAGDVLLQDQLRKVGIDLSLKVLPTAEWFMANASGKYDLTNNYMTRADPIILQTIIDPRAAKNSSLATNVYPAAILPKAFALFDTGLTATADDQRAKAYGDLQDLLVDEGSVFPIYERLWQAATAARVHDFNWTAEGLELFNDIQISK